MRVSYMMHHVAVQRVDTKAPNRFLAESRACFPPPCRAELHRPAFDTAFTLLQASLGKEGAARCESRLSKPLLTVLCAVRESLELPTTATTTQCPRSFRRAVRDLGCTTLGSLEASLAGCLPRKDSRRPDKTRVSLDPVPWESSGSLNAGRHRRGNGRRYRSYHPLGPLSNKHWAAVPLAAFPAGPCPMTTALRRPFQASVHEEKTRGLSVRDMGKCTW